MLKTALIVSLLLAATPALAGQSSSSGPSPAEIE
jgi:hypothetical protein